MIRPLPPRAAGILGYFTRHRTAANLLLVLMVAAGLAAFPQMRAQKKAEATAAEEDE